MNVSRQFLRDFAYLANYYGWTPADIEDVKADTRANPGLVAYWTTLANAHRAATSKPAKTATCVCMFGASRTAGLA